MDPTISYSSKDIAIFNDNQWALAALCPCDRGWEDISLNVNSPLNSVAFRVIFAIIAFIIFPITIALMTKTYTFIIYNYSGFKITQVFARRDAFIPKIRNGLTNFGNSCYINTCIQLLATIDPIVECLRNGNRDSSLKEPLFALLRALKDPTTHEETTKEMVRKFRDLIIGLPAWNTNGRAGENATNDTMEFLEFLVDQLGADLPDISTILPPTIFSIALANENSALQSYLRSNVNCEFPFFILPIDNPSAWFEPPDEITLGGNTFRLSGVVRRPGGNHFVFFQPFADNKLGVTYNDYETKVERNVSEARAVVYTKVVQIINK